MDGTLRANVLNHLPLTESLADADAVIVPITYHADFIFNPGLLALKKPVVILDYMEMGWDAGDKENVLGRNALQQFGNFNSDEWTMLDRWASRHPIALTFKRELHERDLSDTMLPCEFPCGGNIPSIQTKAQFDARPLEVFSSWGLSHPSRQRLHGEIFISAHAYGINVIDGWNQEGRYQRRNWATIHSPWYDRKPMDVIDGWNQQARIGISLPGAGRKCFRSAEAPCGSIMALLEDDMAWSFPWIDGINCIRLTEGEEFFDLETATRHSDLFDIYVESQHTIARYGCERYAREYILQSIEKIL